MHKMFALISTILFTAVSVADTKDVASTTKFEDTKQVEVSGHGDYSHQYANNGGSSNFRLRDGDKHVIDVRPGDTLVKEQGTLTQ